jgi:hypothetical protein
VALDGSSVVQRMKSEPAAKAEVAVNDRASSKLDLFMDQTTPCRF